jgi:two-component sensor histidine kinase
MLDTFRCWRTGLVVSELITNAARHAFRPDHQTGEIVVSVAVAAGQIICGVHDTGKGSSTFTPGFGTTIVDSLAADLGGHMVRRSDEFGTLVELVFPQASANDPHVLGDH